MSVIPKNYADLLETKALAHIATIGPKGDPQNTPVWFGWDGNHVLLTLTKTPASSDTSRENTQSPRFDLYNQDKV